MAQVQANLLVARNHMTSLGGSSRRLSTLEDRKRFHALRGIAGAIAIGGSTFRAEPYSNPALPSPAPLYVSTTKQVRNQPGVRFLNVPPLKLIEVAEAELESDGIVLVEGGVNFLKGLIEAEVIDLIHISRVNRDGDAFEFDETLLRNHYQLVHREGIGETVFEAWEPLRKK